MKRRVSTKVEEKKDIISQLDGSRLCDLDRILYQKIATVDELEKLGLPWCTPNGTKVNYHLKDQQHMYQRMADSGCYQISLAVESGTQRVLDTLITSKTISRNEPSLNTTQI